MAVQEARNIMKTLIRYVAPWLTAAAMGAAIALSPVASAATPVAQHTVVSHPAPSPTRAPTPFETGPDPLVPYGTDPQVPFRLGYVNPNHDEGDFTNGEIDVPF
jgi:hypothetical protein